MRKPHYGHASLSDHLPLPVRFHANDSETGHLNHPGSLILENLVVVMDVLVSRIMIRDLRYAIRGLLGNPGFATVAILTIGIGIGANTTVFSWMRNVLLNPLPAASDPGRIVAIENTADNGDPLKTSFLDYTDYRDYLQFVDLVTLKKIQAFVVGEESHPERVWGEVVSGNFFDLLGVRPEIGRFFN